MIFLAITANVYMSQDRRHQITVHDSGVCWLEQMLPETGELVRRLVLDNLDTALLCARKSALWRGLL